MFPVIILISCVNIFYLILFIYLSLFFPHMRKTACGAAGISEGLSSFTKNSSSCLNVWLDVVFYPGGW